MKYYKICFIISIFIIVISCDPIVSSDHETGIPGKFSETFLEAGKDSDHSYISLRTVREEDEGLDIEIKGWGVEEMGLFLHSKVTDSTLCLRVMADCGTVSSYTWKKTTFNYLMTPVAEDSLNKIMHYSGKDTIVIDRY